MRVRLHLERLNDASISRKVDWRERAGSVLFLPFAIPLAICSYVSLSAPVLSLGELALGGLLAVHPSLIIYDLAIRPALQLAAKLVSQFVAKAGLGILDLASNLSGLKRSVQSNQSADENPIITDEHTSRFEPDIHLSRLESSLEKAVRSVRLEQQGIRLLKAFASLREPTAPSSEPLSVRRRDPCPPAL